MVLASSAGAFPPFSDLVTPSSTWRYWRVFCALPATAPPLRIRTRTSDAGALLPLSRAASASFSFFFCRLTSVNETSFLIMSNTWGAFDWSTTTVAFTVSAGLSTTGTVVKAMFFVGTFFNSRAMSLSVPTLPMALSTVSASVAASASFSSFEGLVRVSLEDILRMSEPRNCCCTLIRSRSPLLPKLLRVRTNARACSPSTVDSPAGRTSLDCLSLTGFSTQTSTPSTAVVSVFTALKSAIMKWSGWMPVFSLTVRMAQPGSRPFSPRLRLKRTPRWPGTIFSEPSSSFVGQSGMSTIRSRGMLSAVALDRSSATCSRIVVSACPELPLSP